MKKWRFHNWFFCIVQVIIITPIGLAGPPAVSRVVMEQSRGHVFVEMNLAVVALVLLWKLNRVWRNLVQVRYLILKICFHVRSFAAAILLEIQKFLLFLIFLRIFGGFFAVHGNFTEWSEWSICAVTCGTGQIHRTRECNNPAPAYNGNDCFGLRKEDQYCSMPNVCPRKLSLVLITRCPLSVITSSKENHNSRFSSSKKPGFKSRLN